MTNGADRKSRLLAAARLPRLRDAFSASSRARLAKKLLATLLMTTALSSSVVQRNTQNDDADWAPSPYDASVQEAAAVRRAPHSMPDVLPGPPARCYRPQRVEKHPMLNLGGGSWRGFYTLSHSGTYGQALHKQAHKLKMSVCLTQDNTTSGTYDAATRSSTINEDADIALAIAQATRDITHALMQQRGLSTPAADETLFSRLNRHLTAEAIASIAPYVVAAELQAAGDSDMMQHLQDDASAHPGLDFFNAQRTLIPGDDNNDSRAIAAAAGKTISMLLRDRAFIEANSDVVLRAYLDELSTTAPKPISARDFNVTALQAMGKISRRSLTDTTQLLTADALATAAPDVAHAVEALQKMHAQHNRYRAPRGVVTQNNYAHVKYADLQAQMRASGGVYTLRQAFARITMSSDYHYEGRTWQQAEAFRHGMQVDYNHAQTPAPLRPLWQQLSLMRTTSPSIAQPLLDHAAVANLVVCYGDLRFNILGQWQPHSGIVVMNPARSGDIVSSTQTLAHELQHAKQSAAELGLLKPSSSIEYSQLSSLSREVTASTTEFLMALEAKLNGDDSLWSFQKEQRFADRMLQVYEEARSAGATHTAAMEAAGLEGYHLLFTRQWWLDTYNNSVAAGMLGNIASGWAKAPDTESYGLDKIRRTGEVSDTFNFTRNLNAVPTEQMLFGDNADMRHLFSYLHLHQLQRNLGAGHESVIAQRNLMREQGNPFTEVDFEHFSGLYNANKKAKLLALMQCLATGGDCLATLAAPIPTPPPAPRTPTCSAG